MDAYNAVCRLLRAGVRMDTEHLDRILTAVGRTHRDLVADVLVGRSPAPGDRCGYCRGTLTVYCSRRQPDGTRLQYLRCGACHRKPAKNKRRVPAR